MEQKKSKITVEEMFEQFAKEYPYLVPNKNNVGRYARKIGLVLMKQVINKKQTYFYVRKEDLK